MNPDTIDLIKQLAARFGMGAEYIWPLMVEYTRWANIAMLGVDLLWLVVSLVAITRCIPGFFKQFYLYNNRDDAQYQDYVIHSLGMLGNGVCLAVFGTAILIILAGIPAHAAGALVPEARTLLDLLAQITAKK